MKFLQLFRSYIEYYRIATGSERRKVGTVRAYEVKYALVNNFLYENKLVNLKCNSFDNELCENFYKWLKQSKYSNKKKNYSINYVIRVIEICQEVIDFGVAKRFINRSNCYTFKLYREEPKEPVYFSSEQIKAFENYESESSLRTSAAVMFVIIMHTGFDYGDFKEVKRHHNVAFKGRNYLIKRRHKNGEKQVIPISTVLNVILEKHDYNIRLLSNAKFNQYLKFVAKDLKINIPLTTKDGRKIFFMNKLNNEGYAMEALSKMGGHKTTRTTEKYYAQVNINLISRELDRLGI